MAIDALIIRTFITVLALYIGNTAARSDGLTARIVRTTGALYTRMRGHAVGVVLAALRV